MRAIALLISCLIITGCGANAEPVIPTVRPTTTVVPTETPTATRVFNASATSLPPTSAALSTNGPTPTSLIGATSTRPPAASATFTVQAAAPGSLSIEYFTTDAQSVKPGDKITLFWSIKGTDHGTIYRLNTDGSHDQLWQVGRAGKLEVKTRADDQDVARFSLSIGDAISRVEQSLSVPLKCAQKGWFFDPPPDSCPGGDATQAPAAQQNFERGQMIWIGTQGRIYVLFNDGKKPAWIVYADEFKDGQPDRDPSLSPPSNLSQPIRGFGLIWRTKEKVRDRLGWATTPELPFDGAYQSDNVAVPDTTLYLRARDKAIVQLLPHGDSWKLIVPGTKK